MGEKRRTREGRFYRYELACVINGGLLLDLSHEGSFGIGGGVEGVVQGIHSCGSGEYEREWYVQLLGFMDFGRIVPQ